jgi:hypothetical protein
MAVPYRPITRIQAVVQELELSISYAYDDLVFIDHNAFLVQMKEKNEQVDVFFNVISDEKSRPEIIQKLTDAGKKQELIITYAGTYSLENTEDEKIQIRFFPDKSTT